MSKKTIQFKLPALTADPDLPAMELDDAGEWVETASPIVSAESIGAFAGELSVSADNDQPVRPGPTASGRPNEGESLFAAVHPGREGVRAFFRGVEGLADCGFVLTLGSQAIAREWLSMPLDAAQRSLDGLQAVGCRTLSDLILLQTSLVRSNIEDALARSGRVTRLSTQVFGEAACTIISGFRVDGRP